MHKALNVLVYFSIQYEPLDEQENSDGSKEKTVFYDNFCRHFQKYQMIIKLKYFRYYIFVIMDSHPDSSMKVVVRVRPLTKKQKQSIKSYEQFWENRKKNLPRAKLNQNALNFFTKYHNVRLSQVVKMQKNCVSVYDHQYKSSEKKMREYIFSNVYGDAYSSFDIFSQTVRPQIQGVLEGFNCSILAYGITGSGKTFSVFGHPKLQKERGMCHQALQFLLEQKKNKQQKHNVVVLKLSFLQIYNENIRDLLSSDGKKLVSISEDNKGNTILSDAQQVTINTIEEATRLISQGIAKRTSAATQSNLISSRSHAIVKIIVEIQGSSHKTCGKLFIIDLAGSEKINLDNSLRKNEGSNINRSLHSLGNCINALVQSTRKGNNSHIPYRDSKLTRLLKDSLGGNAKTIMIACISPHPFTIEETITTLNYAERAQVIKKELSKNIIHNQSVCLRCKNLASPALMASIEETKLEKYDNKYLKENTVLTQILQRLYKDILENAKQAEQLEKLKQAMEEPCQQFEAIVKDNEDQRVYLKRVLFNIVENKLKFYASQSRNEQFPQPKSSERKRIKLSSSLKKHKFQSIDKQNFSQSKLIQTSQKLKTEGRQYLCEKWPSLNCTQTKQPQEKSNIQESAVIHKRIRNKFQVMKRSTSSRRSNSSLRVMTEYIDSNRDKYS